MRITDQNRQDFATTLTSLGTLLRVNPNQIKSGLHGVVKSHAVEAMHKFMIEPTGQGLLKVRNYVEILEYFGVPDTATTTATGTGT